MGASESKEAPSSNMVEMKDNTSAVKGKKYGVSATATGKKSDVIELACVSEKAVAEPSEIKRKAFSEKNRESNHEGSTEVLVETGPNVVLTPDSSSVEEKEHSIEDVHQLLSLVNASVKELRDAVRGNCRLVQRHLDVVEGKQVKPITMDRERNMYKGRHKEPAHKEPEAEASEAKASEAKASEAKASEAKTPEATAPEAKANASDTSEPNSLSATMAGTDAVTEIVEDVGVVAAPMEKKKSFLNKVAGVFHHKKTLAPRSKDTPAVVA